MYTFHALSLCTKFDGMGDSLKSATVDKAIQFCVTGVMIYNSERLSIDEWGFESIAHLTKYPFDKEKLKDSGILSFLVRYQGRNSQYNKQKFSSQILQSIYGD